MKKLLSLVLAMLLAVSCAIGLVACGGKKNPSNTGEGNKPGPILPGPGPDNTSSGKTVIEWANCGGGIGRAWIDAAAAEYEALNANRSFEDGKMGVDIQVEAIKSTLGLVNTTEGRDLITMEYLHINDYAARDLLLDLTPLYYNEDLDGDGVGDFGRYDTDGKTIFQRITADARAFASMPVQNNDGTYSAKYYALPHYEFLSGLTYNRELFEELGCFFTDAQDGSDGGFLFESKFGNAYFIGDGYGDIDEEAVWSPGPDFDFDVPEVGAADYAEKKAARAEDDGLPRSLQELAILCDFLYQQDIAPIQFPGMYQDYANILPCGLYASLAGYEGLQSYSTFKGTIEVIAGNPQTVGGQTASPALKWKLDEPLFEGAYSNKSSNKYFIAGAETEWITMDPDGSITDTADMTKGWYSQEQAAKYYAAAFYELLDKEGFLGPNSYKPTVSHTDSELTFMLGGVGNNPRVGMLMESTYWFNEAGNEGVWNEYSEINQGKDCFDLDIRFMALPSVLTNAHYETSQRTDWSNTMVDTRYCAVFALKQAGNDPQHKLAVYDFLSFLYSEDQLEKFTKRTGMYRPVDIELDQSEFSELSLFTQSYARLRENGKIVRHSGDNPFFVQQGKGLGVQIWGDTWKLGLTTSALAIARQGNAKVREFFEGRRMAPGTWNSYIQSLNGTWVDFGLDEAE